MLGSVATGSPHPSFTLAMPSGTFYLRVQAAEGTTRSAASNEIRVQVNLAAPPTAVAHVIAGVEGSTLSLTWRNTFDGGAPTGVVLDVTGSALASLPLGNTDSVRFNAVPAGTYTLRLRATNASGSSAASAPIAITIPGACTTPPQVPTRFAVYRIGTTLFVQGDPPTSGPAPASYLLNVTGAFVGSIPTLSRALQGTAGAGTYVLSVAAVNGCGVGPATATWSVSIP